MVKLWKKLRLALLATIVLHGYGTCAVPVHAALTSSNVPAHTHASVQQGGSLGAVSATSVTATGAVTGGSVSTAGAVTGGSVSATGAVSGGSISTSGTLSSTKACQSGYTRQTPNYCQKDVETSKTAVRDSCVSLTTVPAAYLGLRLVARGGVVSGNAIGQRSADIKFYTDGACTVAVPGQFYTNALGYAYEFVATVGATLSFYQHEFDLFAGVTAPIWFKLSDDVANTSSGAVWIRGYYD